jgi:hypothetical protein
MLFRQSTAFHARADRQILLFSPNTENISMKNGTLSSLCKNTVLSIAAILCPLLLCPSNATADDISTYGLACDRLVAEIVQDRSDVLEIMGRSGLAFRGQDHGREETGLSRRLCG